MIQKNLIKILSILFLPFKTEKNMLITVTILLALFIFSSIIWSKTLTEIVDYLTKIIFIIWLIWIFETLIELKKMVKEEEKLLETDAENIKKITAATEKIEKESHNMYIELTKHLSMDIAKDTVFLQVLEKLESLLQKEISEKSVLEWYLRKEKKHWELLNKTIAAKNKNKEA